MHFSKVPQTIFNGLKFKIILCRNLNKFVKKTKTNIYFIKLIKLPKMLHETLNKRCLLS